MRKRRHFKRKGPSMLRLRRQRRGPPERGGLNGNPVDTLPEVQGDGVLGHEDIEMEMSEVLVYPPYLKTNRHHRRPKSKGGHETVRGKNGKRYQNIAVVPIQAHEAFNTLFGSATTPERVCAILNRYWIDPRQTIKFYLVDTE